MPLVPLAPLLIAFVGAIFTGFSLIVGKENKTSKNRQAWINDQRNDLGKAISAAFAYVHATSEEEKLKRLELFDEATPKSSFENTHRLRNG